MHKYRRENTLKEKIYSGDGRNALESPSISRAERPTKDKNIEGTIVLNSE